MGLFHMQLMCENQNVCQWFQLPKDSSLEVGPSSFTVRSTVLRFDSYTIEFDRRASASVCSSTSNRMADAGHLSSMLVWWSCRMLDESSLLRKQQAIGRSNGAQAKASPSFPRRYCSIRLCITRNHSGGKKESTIMPG